MVRWRFVWRLIFEGRAVRRILRMTLPLLVGLILLGLLGLLISPKARRLAPTWLYYDLVVHQIDPLPPAVEQYVLSAGQNYCSIGRDSACGGYRLVNARRLQISPAAQQRGISTAWCVDYVVQRQNASRVSGAFIQWANIPHTMVITSGNIGFDSFGVERCDMSILEQ